MITRLEGSLDTSFGNKSRNLAHLAVHDINVPRGIGLGGSLYDENVTSHASDISVLIEGSDPMIAAREIGTMIAAIEFGPDARARLKQEVSGYLRTDRFAVRSSGTGLRSEDGVDGAMAGYFDSYLNVPAELLEDAIKQCWASKFNERNIRLFGSGTLDGSMPVLVQEMVLAEKSVVMMTRDPVEDEPLFGIEATYGPCEALVSGQVEGDLYLLDRETGQLVRSEKGSKHMRIEHATYPTQGRETVPEEAARSENWALSSEEIRELYMLGRRIERIMGAPQDIEAVLSNGIYVVQTRPITTHNKE